MKCVDCAYYVACGPKEGECHLEPPKLIVEESPQQAASYYFACTYADGFCSKFHSKEIVKPGGRRKPVSRGK